MTFACVGTVLPRHAGQLVSPSFAATSIACIPCLVASLCVPRSCHHRTKTQVGCFVLIVQRIALTLVLKEQSTTCRWGSWQCRCWLLSLAIGCQFAQARRDSPLSFPCAFHVESRGFGAANDVIRLLTDMSLLVHYSPDLQRVSLDALWRQHWMSGAVASTTCWEWRLGSSRACRSMSVLGERCTGCVCCTHSCDLNGVRFVSILRS